MTWRCGCIAEKQLPGPDDRVLSGGVSHSRNAGCYTILGVADPGHGWGDDDDTGDRCKECGLPNDDHHYAVGRGPVCPDGCEADE